MNYSLGAVVLRLAIASVLFSSIALSQGALTQYATTIIRLTDTKYITSTLSQSCGKPAGLPSGSSKGTSTGTKAAGPHTSATTSTALDGKKTTISSASVTVIAGSQTVTPHSASSSTLLMVSGETATSLPRLSSLHSIIFTPRSSKVSSSSKGGSGKGSTATPPAASSSTTAARGTSNVPSRPPPSSATATPSSSKAVISITGVTIIGTHTIPIPTGQSTPVTLTTDGLTFTISPLSTPLHTSATATPSSSRGVISNTRVTIVGTHTIPIPTGQSTPVTLTTDGLTITFSALSTPLHLSVTATPSSSKSIISTAGVTIIGTHTIPIPTGQTTPIILTTDGYTLTFAPVNPTSKSLKNPSSSGSEGIIGTESFSTPNGHTTPVTTSKDGITPTILSVVKQTVITSNGIIIIGTDSFPVPTGTTTVTRDGFTLTFPHEIASATDSSTSSSVLSTFTTWPIGASIIPITTNVPEPQYSNGKTETPCKIWFFWICVSWVDLDITIGGFQWILPPGIYPGPPPPNFIKLPPGVTIKGTLPWPTITIGQDNIPTYSSEPTDCKTESVPFCAITTMASATPGAPTVTSCTPILGCNIEGKTASITKSCSASTVTNFVVSCNTNSATSSCKIVSSVAISGCDKMVTTSTTSAPACHIVPTHYINIVEVTSETTIPTGPVTITPTGSTATAPPTLTGLPKLSSSSFSIPAGSSCASSAVSSQCLDGAQGGGCVSTTVCAKWVATTSQTGPLPSSSSTCDDKCKLDHGYPCNCSEDGCDANSPSCCASGNCPSCNCNEDGCDANSPACCASATCQWLTTQKQALRVPPHDKRVEKTLTTLVSFNVKAKSAKA